MNKKSSPGWIKKFLNLFLDERLLEACLGDLEEKYSNRLENNTAHWKANLLYIMEALGFLRMARRKRNTSLHTTYNLISHTFLFFSRLVRKDLSYYLVSLLGLTVSLTSFLFIMMFVNDELAYDKLHEKRDRIYRLTTHLRLNDVAYDMATSQFPAANVIQTEIAEVEHVVRVFTQEHEFLIGDKLFPEPIILADTNFFDVFSFPWLLGDRATALREPGSIVLTQAMATRCFGEENPLGKTILRWNQPLIVTGVIADIPEQSHLKFQAIIPLQWQLGAWKAESGLQGRENKWFWIGAYTYILLQPSADVAQAEAKLPGIINKYFPERYKANGAYKLQPLTDIHLKSSLSNELEAGGNMLYIKLFVIVGLVIMVVSAINLINLSYFKIGARVREVGVRKFLGQNAAKIVAQLSLESMLMGLLAFMLAIGLCVLLIDNFNILVEKHLNLFTISNVQIIAITLGIIMLICLLAVIRPAWQYARQSAGYLLLKKYTTTQTLRWRNLLIGLQVSFSFVLMVFTFIVSGQIDFFRHKNLGFDKENVFAIELNDDIYSHTQAFKNELAKHPAVVDIAGGKVPGTGFDEWRFVPQGGSREKPFLFPLGWVDYSYIHTLNIKLLQGRNFDIRDNYDSAWTFIINKRAAVELGWIDDPIGKSMEIFAPGTTEIMAHGRVIGVIDDFHFESLHKTIQPVVFLPSQDAGTLMIKVSGTSTEVIAHLEKTWKKFSSKPFVYESLDDKIDKLYTNEAKFSNVMMFFTFIALYLTCYGMFAMSSLLFSSKLKEVAIRKVLGADQLMIIRQFYSRYAFFNLISILIGIPVAVYLGNLWLQTFQYRIELDSSFFLQAGVFVLIAGLLSVTYYLIRVAVSNPVKFLRNE
jgi:putative ABC transport system permease protein